MCCYNSQLAEKHNCEPQNAQGPHKSWEVFLETKLALYLPHPPRWSFSTCLEQSEPVESTVSCFMKGAPAASALLTPYRKGLTDKAVRGHQVPVPLDRLLILSWVGCVKVFEALGVAVLSETFQTWVPGSVLTLTLHRVTEGGAFSTK